MTRPRRSFVDRLGAGAVCLFACTGSGCTPADAPSSSRGAARPEAQSGAEKPCEVASLSLFQVPGGPDEERRRLLKLEANGNIVWGDGPRGGDPPLKLTFRSPGCAYVGDMLWVELLPDGDVWLRGHGRIGRLEGNQIVGARGNTRIENDGRVTSSGKTPLDMTVEGYRPGLECASLMLPTLFFGTMPMRTDPPPETTEPDPSSRCTNGS